LIASKKEKIEKMREDYTEPYPASFSLF